MEASAKKLIPLALLAVAVFAFIRFGFVKREENNAQARASQSRLEASEASILEDGQLAETRTPLASTFDAEIILTGITPPDGLDRVDILLTSQEGSKVVSIEASPWRGSLAMAEYRLAAALGPEGAMLLEPAGLLSPSSPTVVASISRLESWTVRVIDKVSGHDLSGIKILALSESEPNPRMVAHLHENAEPPEGLVVLTHDASSPVAIPNGAHETGWFWVHSPGYGWKSLAKNAFQASVTLEMERTGSARLLIGTPNRMPRGDSFLSREGETTPFSLIIESPVNNLRRTIPVAGGETLSIPGLPTGDYCASVVVNPSPAGILAGRTLFSITGNELTEAEVPIQLPEASTGVHLSVVTPMNADVEDWAAIIHRQVNGDWFFVRREPLSAMDELTDNGVYSKTLLDLQPGLYLLELEPTGWQQIVQLDEDHVQEAVIETADWFLLVPRLSGNLGSRAWLSLDYEEDGASRPCSVPAIDNESIICRASSLQVQAFAEGCSSAPVTVTPQPGQTLVVSFNLSAETFHALRVSIWHGSGHALLKPEWWDCLRLKPVGHDGRLLRKDFGPYGTSARMSKHLIEPNYSQSVFIVDSPGIYEVLMHGNLMRRVAIDGITDLALQLE